MSPWAIGRGWTALAFGWLGAVGASTLTAGNGAWTWAAGGCGLVLGALVGWRGDPPEPPVEEATDCRRCARARKRRGDLLCAEAGLAVINPVAYGQPCTFFKAGKPS